MKKYPKYVWKEIDCMEKRLSVFAKEISTSLVLVTTAGSGTANFVFMHEKTGVIIAAPNVNEWSVISTVSLNLFMIYYKQSSLGFWEAQDIQISYNPFFNHFENILYAVKHGKWDSLSTDYQPFLDLADVEMKLEYKLRETEVKMSDIYN
ncbi:hypothetical protein TVAG_268350 [Trichomonas vaginalis G3]|uniref:Uncharacterized protein n=1 Tax=Trichomonas vaginalis (strain ATCC PRA-98 / G3) TaxID=412133 RepID=A2DLI4_TRIV3|nr:protein of unknown function, DUF563 family [Trichomonas vaginalis G3]EAY18802.1 hypothetical protein TVAG_268350 [Trichomonas vaginalis G3]KAI5539259.1 protein of unknown function, DUF563 family [Trichomonas vaginalis G3]|eukprot:XP_001579788.1 hypothetical protein [Trichomonas vaginalis G3]